MVVYWIAFSVLCIIHLYFCYQEHELGRKISKILIMPVLSIYLILNNYKDLDLYFLLFFAFLGDLFLIFKKKIFFIIGALSFSVSHIIVITLLIKGNINEAKIYQYILIGILLFLYIYLLLLFIKNKYLKKLTIPCFAYFFLLVLTLSISILMGNVLVIIGYLFFVASDMVLSITKFIKPIKRRHLYVMLTYIIAQIFIILGLLN